MNFDYRQDPQTRYYIARKPNTPYSVHVVALGNAFAMVYDLAQENDKTPALSWPLVGLVDGLDKLWMEYCPPTGNLLKIDWNILLNGVIEQRIAREAALLAERMKSQLPKLPQPTNIDKFCPRCGKILD